MIPHLVTIEVLEADSVVTNAIRSADGSWRRQSCSGLLARMCSSRNNGRETKTGSLAGPSAANGKTPVKPERDGAGWRGSTKENCRFERARDARRPSRWRRADDKRRENFQKSMRDDDGPPIRYRQTRPDDTTRRNLPGMFADSRSPACRSVPRSVVPYPVSAWHAQQCR